MPWLSVPFLFVPSSKDFTDEIMDLLQALKKDKESGNGIGIDFEKKTFYDILKGFAVRYDFEYLKDKLIPFAKAVDGDPALPCNPKSPSC